MRYSRSFTVLELILVFCLIATFIGVFAGYAGVITSISREEALRTELTNMRTAIYYFRIMNGRPPEDLKELMNKKLTGAPFDSRITQKTFLNPFRIDKDGVLRDPFFNPYLYDAEIGAVSSTTKGYENW
jgi:hypothetical protein